MLTARAAGGVTPIQIAAAAGNPELLRLCLDALHSAAGSDPARRREAGITRASYGAGGGPGQWVSAGGAGGGVGSGGGSGVGGGGSGGGVWSWTADPADDLKAEASAIGVQAELLCRAMEFGAEGRSWPP